MTVINMMKWKDTDDEKKLLYLQQWMFAAKR